MELTPIYRENDIEILKAKEDMRLYVKATYITKYPLIETTVTIALSKDCIKAIKKYFK